VLPGKGAVFHSFLTVLSPSVPIFQMIHLAFRHERESRFSLSLLICLLSLQPKPIPENNQILLESSKHQINQRTTLFLAKQTITKYYKKQIPRTTSYSLTTSNWIIKYVFYTQPPQGFCSSDMR